jgi:hypothetical protein
MEFQRLLNVRDEYILLKILHEFHVEQGEKFPIYRFGEFDDHPFLLFLQYKKLWNDEINPKVNADPSLWKKFSKYDADKCHFLNMNSPDWECGDILISLWTPIKKYLSKIIPRYWEIFGQKKGNCRRENKGGSLMQQIDKLIDETVDLHDKNMDFLTRLDKIALVFYSSGNMMLLPSFEMNKDRARPFKTKISECGDPDRVDITLNPAIVKENQGQKYYVQKYFSNDIGKLRKWIEEQTLQSLFPDFPNVDKIVSLSDISRDGLPVLYSEMSKAQLENFFGKSCDLILNRYKLIENI